MTEPQPYPGSARDRVARGAEQEAPDQAHIAAHQAELEAARPSMQAVPVRIDVADGCVPRTRYLAGSGITQLVPEDSNRSRFVVMAVDEPVVICLTKELAQDAANTTTSAPYPTGFYLPVSIPVPFYSTAQLWIANTSSTPTRVSVMVEKYENPRPDPHR